MSNEPKLQNTPSAIDIEQAAIAAALDKKAKEVVSLDLRNIQDAVADYFIICHGDSPTQVNAIAENVKVELKKHLGEAPVYSEGMQQAEWVLLDYIDVVLHVFQREKRLFYQLEELWSDGVETRYNEMGEPLTDAQKAQNT